MSESVMQQDDVFSQVEIDLKVMDAWLEAISEIAVSFRLRQLGQPVRVKHDAAFLTPGGALTMITEVAGEPVRMVVPEGMWNWQENRQ